MKSIDEKYFSVTLDSGALIVDFNGTASQISGYSKKELLGKNWFEIFIPDSNIVEVLGVFSSIFNGNNTSWEYENEITIKDGSLKTIKWQNSIIKNDRNQPLFIHSLGTEV